MNHLSAAAILMLGVTITACSASDVRPATALEHALSVPFKQISENPHETILLVSLEDGTIVMQKIQNDADICFKSISDSATTCLTQGEPVIDPASNTVVGFEMIEDQIQLVAKTD